jgi:hypothetical protein
MVERVRDKPSSQVRRNAMMSRVVSVAAAIVLVSGMLVPAAAPRAQEREREREAEMRRLHELCDHGDRRACVRFGIILGESRERHEEWRRLHPEYFWWER